MSSDTRTEHVTCSNCGSSLVTDGLPPDTVVMCAGCHDVLELTDRQSDRRVSRRAVASLILGCLSLAGLFLTGIPAILLGISALRRIRQNPRTLTGTWLAVGGIAAGSVFGLFCGACLTFSLVMAIAGRQSMVDTDDPQEVRQIGEEIVRCDLPPGVRPLKATDFRMAGMRTAVYGNEPRDAHPVIVLMQLMQGVSPAQTEQRFREMARPEDGRSGPFDIESTEELTYTIRGRPVTVTKSIGVDHPTGVRYREYEVHLSVSGHIAAVVVMTPDQTSSEPSRTALGEEEVQRFFESIR